MKRDMKGSPNRDEFKRRHKDICRDLWSCDIDFMFVEKSPVPDIVAAIDYKTDDDKIQFSEVIAYNSLRRRGIPVFIIRGDSVSGKFDILRYDGGHHRQPRYTLTLVAKTEDWQGLERWELSLRREFGEQYGDY